MSDLVTRAVWHGDAFGPGFWRTRGDAHETALGNVSASISVFEALWKKMNSLK
jgi:hypothetical protein